jgi:short-subunit dehydrogenase
MKKIIIIGATSGMGKGLAQLYIQAGWQVGVTGRRQGLLEELQQQYPQQVFTECFNVTGPDNIPHLKNLIAQMGGMDVFVYNAGYGDPSETLDWTIELATTLTNVNGFVEMTNYAYNYFLQQGQGQIAATSSIAAYRGNSFAPAYSAGKAYMSTYMEGLHMKSRKTKAGIVITDIQPGFVKTKMAKGNGQFWVAPVNKAVRQIYKAIEKKKKRAFITRRWVIIAWLMKRMPYFIYKRIG